ncbi:antibiotic biosynthesis monooxygenase family protein [Bacillus sp. SD088]|uniref:antibiotic biosynthesis monooxygenase family protein n=1 Tax=Bacillus sp. SD088 TaxID=2782012 RepID=UPI001A95EE81|nr:antibiotic biosynthesis monooxygenase [Bacillus sp. SD088]MBO0993627.1 antibiotic biosynthesis monooxygenase [Bacillus sp. SD088]
MYMYITAGTYPYLKKLEEQHPTEKMMLMQNMRTTELWHETNKGSFFQSPRKYETMDAFGHFASEGFVACHYVSVRDENRPLFEYNFENKLTLIKQEEGIIAARILRPLSSEIYIIMTLWQTESFYVRWEKSSTFAQFQIPQHLGNMFSSPPHTYTYIVSEDEIEELDDDPFNPESS